MSSPTLSACRFPKRSLEDLLVDAARDFDVIRNASRPGPILVAAVDGKGVPMVKPDGARQTAHGSPRDNGQIAGEWPRWPQCLLRIHECAPWSR